MKLRFKRFRIKNALSFASADMPLDEQGLVLIRGENLDEGGSNGAGKSTIFELLYNLLYDKLTKTDRKIKKSELLNLHRPHDFLLRLDVEPDSVPYQIDKFRSHKKLGTGFRILKNGVNITPDHPSDSQKLISSLTGQTANEFLGRVYLSQRHIHTMIEGTPSQKKDYLSRCFGWDTLDLVAKETTRRLNSIPLPDENHLKSLLQGVESDLLAIPPESDLEFSIGKLSYERDIAQESLVSWRLVVSKQEEARTAHAQREEWTAKLNDLGLQLSPSQLQEQLKQWRLKVKEIENSIGTFTKRSSLEARLASEAVNLPEEVDYDAEELLGKVAKKLSKLERLLPEVRRRAEVEVKLQNIPEPTLSEEEYEEILTRQQARSTKVSDRVAALKAEISQVSKVEDVCYVCQRPFSSEEKEDFLSIRTSSLKESQEKLSVLLADVSATAKDLDLCRKRSSLISQLESLPEGDLAFLQAEIARLGEKQKSLQALSMRLARIQTLREQLSELPHVHESLPVLQQDLADLVKKIDLVDSCYLWLLEFGALRFDPLELERALSSVNEMSERLTSFSQDLAAFSAEKAKRGALTKQKQEIEKTLALSEVERSRSRVLRSINVSLGELKKLSLRESTQLLSSVLPNYLSQLFPDGSIKLSVTDDAEGFDLTFNKGGAATPLTLISGGQAKRVGIAIVFSFARLGRNTSNLLILDEPFRDLDQKGREACFELLRDFDMGTILVTSHDQDMNAPKKYDQVWTVRMLNHVSRLYLDG